MSEIYRKLQERLDTYSIGFPATEQGGEIRILQRLFTEADARMFLELSPALETADAVALRVGRDAGPVVDELENMAGRGLVFRLKKDAQIRYAAIPFMHGILEYQVGRMEPDLWRMVEEYLAAGLGDTIARNSDTFIRTIPVGESVAEDLNIAPYEDALKILHAKKLIVVADCLCRKGRSLVGQGCGKPVEVCFMFDSMAQYYIDQGLGRRISVEEGCEILKSCHAAGLVTQPGTAQNPSVMCNCCGDCCAVLQALNALDNPAGKVFSNYFAVIDPEDCLGCEACAGRCPMHAIGLNNNAAAVDPRRCIGCGLCVSACPPQSISLQKKAEPQYRIPPATSAEQLLMMAKKRGLL